MNCNFQRSPEETPEAVTLLPSGGLDSSPSHIESRTLASLPLGARLILRCRKDWRAAAVVAVTLEQITLSVASPSGHTYRVRRPADAALSFEGPIAILGEGLWRAGFVRY
ncbi:MAG: hypothetical protein LC742_03315, partial [Acidobacteria bacterium]|nr:hypothetical protein [Acidobacteriota bacterium]